MNRSTLRLTAIAAMTTLAGFGAQGMEAEQWNPQLDYTSGTLTDATRTHTAWPVQHGDATEFHDEVSRDTMATRAAVRNDYRIARSRGLLNDTGEAGATERVLTQRNAFVREEHDRIVALNAPAPEEDQIGDLIAALALTDKWDPDSFAASSSIALAPDDVVLRLPTNQ